MTRTIPCISKRGYIINSATILQKMRSSLISRRCMWLTDLEQWILQMAISTTEVTIRFSSWLVSEIKPLVMSCVSLESAILHKVERQSLSDQTIQAMTEWESRKVLTWAEPSIFAGFPCLLSTTCAILSMNQSTISIGKFSTSQSSNPLSEQRPVSTRTWSIYRWAGPLLMVISSQWPGEDSLMQIATLKISWARHTCIIILVGRHYGLGMIRGSMV